jgi:hypothetical protein
VAAGEKLPADQLALFERHPEVARGLLVKIPRLQGVAEMVYRQSSTARPSDDPTVALGGRMLAAALDFDGYLSVGATRKQALEALRKAEEEYDSNVLDALATARMPSSTDVAQVMSVSRLRIGMVIRDEVRNTAGNLIVSGGHEGTEGSLQRLRNYARLKSLGKMESRVDMPQAAGNGGETAAA